MDDALTDKLGYKSVTFVNKVTKEVHVSTAGTVPTDIYDLYDDMLIGLGKVPTKIEPLKDMVTKVMDLLKDQDGSAEYTFSTSGHSLGSVISDLTLAEIQSRGGKIDKSTTFENPGSKIVMEKAIKDGLFTGDVELSAEELSTHSEIYNSRPNVINQACEQLGKTHLVIPVESESSTEAEASSGYYFASYLYNTVGSVVKSCSDLLGITSVIGLKSGHSLQNFSDVEASAVLPVSDWSKKVDGALVVDAIEGHGDLESTGSDVIVFEESDFEDYLVLDAETYAFADLKGLGSVEVKAEFEIELSGGFEIQDSYLEI